MSAVSSKWAWPCPRIVCRRDSVVVGEGDEDGDAETLNGLDNVDGRVARAPEPEPEPEPEPVGVS